jgi:PAS domain S-box-containing protein
MILLTLKINKNELIQEVCFRHTAFFNESLPARDMYFFSLLEENNIYLPPIDLKSITDKKQIETVYSKNYLYQIDFIPESLFNHHSDIIAVNISQYNKAFPHIELYLKNIVNNLPHAIFWKNTNSEFLGCNTAFAKFAGITPEEIVGKTDYDMPWKEHAYEYRKTDQFIIHSGEACINFEETNREAILLVSKVPISDNHQNVVGVLGIYADITDKKRAEHLEKERAIAEKSAELMKILSSSVAHEVRTPLSIIKVNHDLMQLSSVLEAIPETPEKEQFLSHMNTINKMIKECAQVIDMLLVKLRRIASCESEYKNLDTCSIKDTIKITLEEYPFRNNERKYLCFKEKEVRDFLFKGHERLTKHVLFNLLRNSLHAIIEAKKGGIFIETKKGKKFNQLIFKDSALGISEEYLPKIFNKFETTNETNSGTGLGLVFCKLVMESFGGKIECRSELGHFTEFILSFPVE